MSDPSFTCARCLRSVRRDEPVVPVGVDPERQLPNFACESCWTPEERAAEENPPPYDPGDLFGVLHETESGDVAPGFPPFDVDVG